MNIFNIKYYGQKSKTPTTAQLAATDTLVATNSNRSYYHTWNTDGSRVDCIFYTGF